MRTEINALGTVHLHVDVAGRDDLVRAVDLNVGREVPIEKRAFAVDDESILDPYIVVIGQIRPPSIRRVPHDSTIA
jgi:hypothetical protein